MPEMPEEPMNPLSEGAVSLHEMFVSLRQAEFTEDQALKLLALYLRTGVDGDA